jgi:hypothetical protein
MVPAWRLEQILVLALASNRLARAVTVDEITAPARQRLVAWADEHLSTAGRSRLEQLITCPVCTGWWTSIGLSLLTPGPRRIRRGMAVAGAQVLLTLAERLVSERGRAAIHEAELVEAAAEDGTGMLPVVRSA